MADSVTLTLSRPIQVVGEMRATLALREPDGGMLARAGSYVRIIHLDSGETAIEPIPGGMLKLIAACAGVPVRSIEMLAGRDFQEAQSAVMRFLAPDPAPETNSSTDTSNAPDGGATPASSSA
jgi:hypothetical protein